MKITKAGKTTKKPAVKQSTLSSDIFSSNYLKYNVKTNKTSVKKSYFKKEVLQRDFKISSLLKKIWSYQFIF